MSGERERRFRKLVEYAEATEEVVGLFVFGSRGRGLFVDERSDYDVAVVLSDDDALERFDALWPYEHGAPVEVVGSTLEQLRTHAEFGSSSEWARYQYAHIEPLLDRTGGEVGRIVASKEGIPGEHRERIVRDALGAYVNSTYRSLRYRTRLDAVESVAPALTAIFAFDCRIRPFNTYLAWELEHHPLGEHAWAEGRLMPLFERVLDADRSAQHMLFRDVERVARAHGFGAELDEWEPDLAWLRGEAGYRAG